MKQLIYLLLHCLSFLYLNKSPTMKPSTYLSFPHRRFHYVNKSPTMKRSTCLLLHHQSFHQIGIASSTVSASGVSIRPQEPHNETVNIFMSRNVKRCQDMSRDVKKVWQDMSGYVKICQDMSRHFKIWHLLNKSGWGYSSKWIIYFLLCTDGGLHSVAQHCTGRFAQRPCTDALHSLARVGWFGLAQPALTSFNQP